MKLRTSPSGWVRRLLVSALVLVALAAGAYYWAERIYGDYYRGAIEESRRLNPGT